MRVTTKSRILSYLKTRDWISGTELEDQARPWLTKPSVVTRRARELANDGYLERKLGERGTVQYRVPVKDRAPVYTVLPWTGKEY